jgi:hypothetical protein
MATSQRAPMTLRRGTMQAAPRVLHRFPAMIAERHNPDPSMLNAVMAVEEMRLLWLADFAQLRADLQPWYVRLYCRLRLWWATV